MKFLISCIGKIKPGPEKALLDHYTSRLQVSLDIREFDTKPALAVEKRQAFEAEKLLSPFTPTDYLIALDEKGKALSSSEFAQVIDSAQTASVKTMGFLIGGADGLDTRIFERANLKLSLGRMTWPHMLVRPLIVEQIYRGLSILSNHPYHRE